MMKIYSLLTIFLISALGFSQGTESFENAALSKSYKSDSFSGETPGVTVNYAQARDQDTYGINGQGIILRISDQPGFVEFNILNGVGTFSFEYRRAYSSTTARQLAVVVDGIEVDTTPSFGKETDVYQFSTEINKEGNVSVKITYSAGTVKGNKQSINR